MSERTTASPEATARLELDGRQLHVPMDFAELSLMAQVLSVRTHDARRFLEGTPLRPAELWRGTSAVALLFAQYRRSPLDTFGALQTCWGGVRCGRTITEIRSQ